MNRLLTSSIIALLALPVSFAWPGQDQETVLLRWSVPAGKAIGFKASMQQGGAASSTGLQFDLDALTKMANTPEASKEMKEKIKSFFEGFKLPKEFSMTTLLKRPPEGDISVLLIAGKLPGIQTPAPEFTEMLKKMEGTVQLRGQIDASGAITSFWLAPNQKNLLALFCELPKTPVKVGDRWSLNVNFVQMGFGFVADKANRLNQVELSGVQKEADGEVVAVLDYIIAESVEGNFQMGDQTKATTMAMSFAGRGRFSVTKGLWKSFAGRMKTKATGMMASSAEQELALEPLPSIPDELLKLK